MTEIDFKPRSPFYQDCCFLHSSTVFVKLRELCDLWKRNCCCPWPLILLLEDSKTQTSLYFKANVERGVPLRPSLILLPEVSRG